MGKMRPKIQYKKMPEEKAKAIKKGNDIIPVRLDLKGEQRKMLEESKKILCVDRDSTIIKELMILGFHVLHDTHIGKLIPIISERIRRGLYDSVLSTQEKMEKSITKEE